MSAVSERISKMSVVVFVVLMMAGTVLELVMVAGVAIGLLKLHSLPADEDGKLWIIIIIAAALLGILILIIGIIALCCWLRKKKTKQFEQIEAFIEMHEERATKRYKYSDVKKMTNSFTDKLGEGGYGSVFKGQLPNGGAMVAVKRLSETSRGNGDDFINELGSISKTFHINLVTYLGYCVEGGRRALIYEFMPRGSLEKYIYFKKSVQEQSRLGLTILYNIAIGIADGLQYLHGGCPTRILHLDIKPSNILLDHEYIPKISDFGLAKLCAASRSTVSLEGTRGTPGYMAPELQSGGVSRKADVYSYGKMLLEMAGGRKIFDVETEIYYPPWIYDRLVSNGNLELYGITTREEEQIARKMIVVGLLCVQTDPAVRPQMSEVVQMLKGSLESLPIPYRPASI